MRAIKVGRDDFLDALGEVLPRFGADDNEFTNCMTNGVLQYSERFVKLLRTCNQFVNQVRATDRTPLMSVLLEGDVGAGKTALAAYLAQESKFPFIKLLSPEHMIGITESVRGGGVVVVRVVLMLTAVVCGGALFLLLRAVFGLCRVMPSRVSRTPCFPPPVSLSHAHAALPDRTLLRRCCARPCFLWSHCVPARTHALSLLPAPLALGPCVQAGQGV
jgi:hypothetical protein